MAKFGDVGGGVRTAEMAGEPDQVTGLRVPPADVLEAQLQVFGVKEPGQP